MNKPEYFEELIGKQVGCYVNTKDGKIKLDKNLLGLLSIMYPTFKVVYSEFDITWGQPFIYAGDAKWINKVNKHEEPHICVAPTGDYDFTKRQTLIDLAYLHHNSKEPQYLHDLVESWDDETFYYNWKLLWLNGTVPDKEIVKQDLFLKIITNFSKPIDLVKNYLEGSNDMSTRFLENMLISFIIKSKDIDETNTKNKTMFKIRQQFYYSYNKYIPQAVNNLITSDIINTKLLNLNFLLDLSIPDRNKSF